MKQLKSILATLAPAIVILILFKGGSLLTKANPIDREQLGKEIQSGEPVLLQFHAYWCSTCLIQKASLKMALSNKPFSNLHVHSVDFDSEHELKDAYNVNSQSTLVLMNQKKEVARSIGVTSPSDIEKFIETGLLHHE